LPVKSSVDVIILNLILWMTYKFHKINAYLNVSVVIPSRFIKPN